MSGFWEKKLGPNATTAVSSEEINVVIDEQAMQEFQEDPAVNLAFPDDEEEDMAATMLDVNLRLEQGRLYQMVMKHDLFGETDADPRAIKNVQRQIRKFVREQMETMVGIRQEQPKQTVVSSPFNDLEVTALKMMASRITKGASEEVPSQSPIAPSPPKKDGITSVSGNLRPNTAPTPLNNKPKTEIKPQPAKKALPSKPSIKTEEETLLKKPIAEMTPQELLDYEKAASERRAKNKSALPSNLVPHPTPQQLELLYAQAAGNVSIANPWRVNG